MSPTASVGLLVAVMVVATSGFSLTPPENRWVGLNKTTILRCYGSEKLASCSWQRPKNEKNEDVLFFTMDKDVLIEDRFTNPAESDKECALKIENVAHHDEGEWTCHVQSDTLPVKFGHGKATIGIATKPNNVRIADTFDEAKTTQEVTCVVDDANPKPSFKWFVDDEELEDAVLGEVEKRRDLGEDVWSQTLTYAANVEHANKTLRCVVDHVGFGNEDDLDRQASVDLQFKYEVLLRSGNANNSDTETNFTQANVIGAIVGSVLACAVVIGVAFNLIQRYGVVGVRNSDPEKGKDTETDGTNTNSNPNSGTTTPEKADLTKEQLATMEAKAEAEKDVQNKMGKRVNMAEIGERVAAFFRLNKSAALPDDDKEEDTKVLKVDGEASEEETEKKSNDGNADGKSEGKSEATDTKINMDGEDDEKAKETEANGDATDGHETAETEENSAAAPASNNRMIGSFFSRLFKKKTASAEAKEDSVRMQKVDITDEIVDIAKTASDEEEKEKVEEQQQPLDNADKEAKVEPEVDAEVKKAEMASAPINTSF